MLHAYGHEGAERERHNMTKSLKHLEGRLKFAAQSFSVREPFRPEELWKEIVVLTQATDAGQVTPGKPVNPQVRTVMDAIESRRKQLDMRYSECQRLLTAGNEQFRHWNRLPSLPAAENDLPLVGRIAIDIALHVALLRRSSRIAEAYLDACDSLTFLSDALSKPFEAAVAGRAPASPEEPYPLIHAVDTARLFALLAERELQQAHRAWSAELGRHEAGLMRPEDFEFEQRDLDMLETLRFEPDRS